jgi:hypothetical protein
VFTVPPAVSTTLEGVSVHMGWSATLAPVGAATVHVNGIVPAKLPTDVNTRVTRGESA